LRPASGSGLARQPMRSSIMRPGGVYPSATSGGRVRHVRLGPKVIKTSSCAYGCYGNAQGEQCRSTLSRCLVHAADQKSPQSEFLFRCYSDPISARISRTSSSSAAVTFRPSLSSSAKAASSRRASPALTPARAYKQSRSVTGT
jgi:hypothetical protein